MFSNKKQAMVIILLMLLLAVSLAMTGCGQKAATTGAPDQVIELKVAHFWPSTHQIETEFLASWSKSISEATNGRVKIVTFPGETLLKSAAIYDGVVSGVTDIGMSCYAYNAGKFPVMETYTVPGISFKTSVAASKAAYELATTLKPQELQDTHHLMIFAAGPGCLATKQPIEKLEDFAGKDIAVTSAYRKSALDLLGAKPVVMPVAEHYEALSRGVIKSGLLVNEESLKGFRLGELASYVTKTSLLYNQPFFMTMNLEKWNSLPPDIQQAITEVCEEYADMTNSMWDRIDQAGLKWTLELSNPPKVITITPEEESKWAARLEPLLQDYAKSLDAKGLDGDQIVATAKQIADKYNQ